jgi:hypothetical protein
MPAKNAAEVPEICCLELGRKTLAEFGFFLDEELVITDAQANRCHSR